MLRQLRRAPGRIIASVLALALAVGAVGVFAIPTVSHRALATAVERDRLGDVIVATTPLDGEQLDAIGALDHVEIVEAGVDTGATLDDGRQVRLVGVPLGEQRLNVLHVTGGRLASSPGEAVVSSDVAAIGTRLTLDDGTTFDVVGHGDTLWWSGQDTVYVDLPEAVALTPAGGTNLLSIVADDDAGDVLRSLADEVRLTLTRSGAGFNDFPIFLADGETPLDDDMRQISSMIGLLGIVAGLVALVLLASTTNTLIAERSREIAVMRALGASRRRLRRRLRRIALAITAAALVVGLPLGALLSYWITRMVLEKFVGVTPGFAINWVVIGASAVGSLLGARLVSARAARRATKPALAEALRDRDGAPFGRRWAHRAAARVAVGSDLGRTAWRTAVRRPAHAVAVVAQVSAAVAAAFLIPNLAASVAGFNDAARAPWTWESRAIARDAGLPFTVEEIEDGRLSATDRTVEAGISVWGETRDLDVDVYGLDPATQMFDATMRDGRWLDGPRREVVVSAGFAARTGIELGAELDVELATGTQRYRVVGLADDYARAVYIDRTVLGSDLGAPGAVNVVWSQQPWGSLELPGAVDVATADELAAEDTQGRNAIVAIFAVIAAVVTGVAALSVISAMTVSLYERRHELAALQAIGATRRRLRGLVYRELLPLCALGLAGGLALGRFGTDQIMGAFERANAIDIGVTYQYRSIPVIVVTTVVGVMLLGRVIVRAAGRRPIAETLRGAA